MSVRSFFKSRPRLGSKLGAFALALILWLYVGLNETVSNDVEFRLVPVNIKPGKTIVNRLPETVTINVTGKGINLLWLNLFWQSEMQLTLDLRTINYFYDFPIKEDQYLSWIKMPGTFEDEVVINSIVFPDTIKVELDDLAAKRIPVSAKNINVITKDGYMMVDDIHFEPDSVDLNGPNRFVQNMDEIMTAPMELSNKSRDFSDEVELISYENIDYTISAERVRFSVDIQKIGQITIPDIPIRVLHQPRAVSVEVKPSTLSITLSGGVDQIKNFSSQDIAASVIYDRNWRRGGAYIVNVDVNVPENILSFEISPVNFRVEVK